LECNGFYKEKAFEFSMEKRIACGMVLMLLFSVSLVSAITGSMGNARMILNAEVGDEIEKYILVKNVNDVDLNIELFPSGDLADSITILDNNFTITPGNEKKAKFLIDVTKAGTTETTINVKFSPVDGGNGVGLMSTVIVKAGGESESGDDSVVDDVLSGITGGVVGVKDNVGVIVVVLMGLLLVLLIVVYIYMLKKTKQKKEVGDK
jgi:hypothetical protein